MRKKEEYNFMLDDEVHNLADKTVQELEVIHVELGRDINDLDNLMEYILMEFDKFDDVEVENIIKRLYNGTVIVKV